MQTTTRKQYTFTVRNGQVHVTVNGNPIDIFTTDEVLQVAANEWMEVWG